MTKLLIPVGLLLTVCACSKPKLDYPEIGLTLPDDSNLKKSQLFACVYIANRTPPMLTCMSPEEFMIRSQAADEDADVDAGPVDDSDDDSP